MVSGLEGFHCNIIINHTYCCIHIAQVQDEDGVYGTVMASPSVTPRSRSNPSFRVFTMDPSSSYQLLGYQQYHLNLTLANGRRGLILLSLIIAM